MESSFDEPQDGPLKLSKHSGEFLAIITSATAGGGALLGYYLNEIGVFVAVVLAVTGSKLFGSVVLDEAKRRD